MSTFKFAAVAIVAMLFALVPTSAAFAAYEDPAIDVDVHPTTLIGGGSFSGTAESNGVICDWTVTFRGETKTGVGTEISFTFDTPVVDEETERDLKVVCVYDDDNTTQLSGQAGVATAQSASYSTTQTLPTVLQRLSRTVTITLLPESDDDDGDDDGDGKAAAGHFPTPAAVAGSS